MMPLVQVVMSAVSLSLSSEPVLSQERQLFDHVLRHPGGLLDSCMVEQEVVPLGGAWDRDHVLPLPQQPGECQSGHVHPFTLCNCSHLFHDCQIVVEIFLRQIPSPTRPLVLEVGR